MRRKEFEKGGSEGDASRLKVGIAVARFHEDITSSLLDGAQKVLSRWNVHTENMYVAHTFGSFELPFACQRLHRKYRPDALIAIGCIIKGETSHDKHLATAVMHGLTRVSIDLGVPVGLAVLTVDTLAQAKARSRGSYNHGAKAAEAALQAANIAR